MSSNQSSLDQVSNSMRSGSKPQLDASFSSVRERTWQRKECVKERRRDKKTRRKRKRENETLTSCVCGWCLWFVLEMAVAAGDMDAHTLAEWVFALHTTHYPSCGRGTHHCHHVLIPSFLSQVWRQPFQRDLHLCEGDHFWCFVRIIRTQKCAYWERVCRSKPQFYGPGGSYSVLAGRDCSRGIFVSLSTRCDIMSLTPSWPTQLWPSHRWNLKTLKALLSQISPLVGECRRTEREREDLY